ncbi:hypothetical protein TKK_0018694 [Trichogramma kaykai]
MGKKKSSKKEESRLAREVARLVKKQLKNGKKRSRRHRSSSSSSSSSSSNASDTSECRGKKRARRESRSEEPEYEEDQSSGHQSEEEEIIASKTELGNKDGEKQQTKTVVQCPPSKRTSIDQVSTKVEEKTLKQDVLDALGKKLTEERIFTEPIHSLLVSRWQEVYKLGLPKEEREELIKKFPPAQNCIFLDPPALNKEISLAIHETVRNRDARLVQKHAKLQACTGAIAKVFTELVKRDDDRDVPLIEALSAASRLIIDSMHEESAVRKALIMSNVNPGFKDVLSSTQPDEFLFGKNLSEGLKQAQLTTKDVQILARKPTQPKNSKGPGRNQDRSQSTTRNGPQRSAAKEQFKSIQEQPKRQPQELVRPTQQSEDRLCTTEFEEILVEDETPSSVEIDYPGGRECIRAALIKQGVPKSAIDVSLALIGESTIKSYIPVLKKWWSFCRLKRENIFRPTSSQVIEFLQTEFDRGMSHSSLNLARSAISLVATTDIGNYQIIRRFFRGVIRLHVGSKDHLRLLL